MGLIHAIFVLLWMGTALGADLVDEVYLPMGVAGGSNCTIGPQLPHASTNPGPDTRDGSHDGYHPQRPIRGFSQLHVSGTGWGQYGNMLISPQVGLEVRPEEHDSEKAEEAARPDGYEVTLTRWGIKAEVSPTHHGAIYRFTYPQTDDATLMLDVAHSIATDIAKELRGKFLGGSARVVSAKPLEIEATGKYQGGFGHGAYDVHVVIRCDRDAVEAGTWRDAEVNAEAVVEGKKRVGAWARFDATNERVVVARVGVSLASVAKAREYLEREMPVSDFDAVKLQAREKWNQTLGKIRVEGGSADERRLFYTSLYHSLLMPRDRTGDNARWKSDEPFWDDHYAVWDTWRTKLPLLMLIDTEAMCGIVRSFVDRHEHGGRVADAFVAGAESSDQGGNGPDNVIADAYVKGLDGVDWQRAWGLLKKHATEGRRPEFRERGWIPAGKMSCSDTLEMAYNDACAAQVAKGLGHDADAAMLRQRSGKWAELWRGDLESGGYHGFIAPRKADGSWVEPFDPRQVHGSWENYFYEGSSWNYSFLVPHDVAGLIEKCGGAERFVERLEYACQNRLVEMWNEPAFLTLRLFTYAGRPDLTTKWVRQTMNSRWNLKSGYPGNEDSGAMGSWYVLSAVGLFPVAGQDLYILNTPAFERTTISTEGGRQFVLEARGPLSGYITAAKLNGRALDRAWLRHGEITAGGVLELTLSAEPGDWGTGLLPPAMSSGE